mgnify:CR=1 FL=1
MTKSVYDIAAENDFKIVTVYTKAQNHGGEYSYLRVVSKTWPHIVLTYKGMSLIKSARMGTLRYSLFDSDPEIFSSEIDPQNIPAKRMTQAAKAFADADNIMAELKEFDPELPAWKEYEEPGDR